jgi:cyclopropane fatty-acyl-phospholipid synthase-like methyltransferase
VAYYNFSFPEGKQEETMMDVTHRTDDEQTRLWNGVAGRAWVETQDLVEEMFRPFEDLLVEAVCAGPRARVLDVGCGTGSVTLGAARRAGA